jgi:molybdopterin converting factor small subunit
MRLRLRLHAQLRDLLPSAGTLTGHELELPDGATVDSLCQRLGLSGPRLVYIDHRRVSGERLLAEGETVHVMPPLAGG